MHPLPRPVSLVIVITSLDIFQVRQGGISLLLSNIRFDSHSKWGVDCPHHCLWALRHTCGTMEQGWYSEPLQRTPGCQQVNGRLPCARGISRVRTIGSDSPSTRPIECPAPPAAERAFIIPACVRLFGNRAFSPRHSEPLIECSTYRHK